MSSNNKVHKMKIETNLLDCELEGSQTIPGNQCNNLTMNQIHQMCKVCGEPAAGFHFGAFTCEGCKSFFGRTYNNVSGIAECKNGGRCEINKKNRTSCKSCRLRKCLRVGMSKSGSRYGRRSNWFKIHCLLQAQGQVNGMGNGPETNNNNSTVTNNNSPNNYQSSFGKSQLPSTITSSFGSSIGNHGDREDREERERTPSSSASRNGGTNGLSPAFTSLASLSPESLSSLNRKLNSSDLADYFRAAGMGGMPGKAGSGGGKSSFYSEEERGEDMSRTTRSPGSLESPRSEASVDDGKSNTPLFTMPPGSPLEVKPNDLLSFDLITRDLMKMGYDPLRLWPAMFTAQPNIHQFNPYRFIFPNFPGAPAGFPGGFPPNPNSVPPPLLNGGIHPAAKLFSAASMAGEGLPSPLANLPGNLNAVNLHAAAAAQNHSPNCRTSPPNNQTSIRSRVTPIVPPSSSLTLTPPISHHGSDDPTLFPMQKIRNVPLQEKPIDLSAKSTNNNHVDVLYNSDKMYSRMNGDMSEDENMCDNDSENERDYNSDIEMKHDIKSDYDGSSERGDDEVEDLSRSSNNNNIINKNNSRRSSCVSRSRSPSPQQRVGTPLDLTRSSGGASNSSPPIAKIAT